MKKTAVKTAQEEENSVNVLRTCEHFYAVRRVRQIRARRVLLAAKYAVSYTHLTLPTIYSV